MENSVEGPQEVIFFKKLKVEVPYDSKIAQLGIYPDDIKVVS